MNQSLKVKKNKEAYIHSEDTHNPASAKEVVPLLMELFQPKSVIDVGCGLGEWLHVFQNAGIEQVLGLNGSWVKLENLFINPNFFQEINLINPKPIQGKFDLILCLEVAEHLPKSSAETLVEFLISLGNTIIFSAAIPGQGGQNHINEQWPSYWADLFSKHGFKFYDTIRPKIWDKPNIKWWYRQNMFLVSNQKMNISSSHLSLVHPELHLNEVRKNHKMENGLLGLKYSSNILIKSLKQFISRK